MDLQKMVDALSAYGRNERSNYHLTLGKAIERLSKFELTESIRFDYLDAYPGNPHSYRGYYSDLAFEPCKTTENSKLQGFLASLSHSRNREFIGWKGGEFVMAEDTPLWVADKGDCGRAIMDIGHSEEGLILITKQIED